MSKSENVWKRFHKRNVIDGTVKLSKSNLWPSTWCLAGRCVTTFYSSDKWQKDRSFFERYYHDHGRKTNIYLPKGEFPWLGASPDKKYMGRPKEAAILGYALGFDIKRSNGKKAKLTPAKGSLLICGPGERVLYVVEDGKIAALICGPSLKIEARGIVG